ncbi:hypothetical protein [Maridesulfovibrio sp.]|uniref:hypothetical protein n=1 Tax=Maridesulfovibrio sp. TaxID=2795000 RepID=UPI002A18AD19|nr:hypothetical protein [Maridesulfovibrio sp.]
MNDKDRKRLAHLKANPQHCSVPGCFGYRKNFSQYCQYHDDRNRSTGHPLGKTVTKGELRPYLEKAQTFTEANKNHGALVGARIVLGDLLAKAQWHEINHKSKAVWPRVSNWLVTLRNAGVKPSDILTVIIAMFLMQEDEPRRFHNDREFRHSLITRILRLPSSRKEWEGKTIYRKNRITVGVKDFLADRICDSAIGSFALNVARQVIKKEREERQTLPSHLEDMDKPFNL